MAASLWLYFCALSLQSLLLWSLSVPSCVRVAKVVFNGWEKKADGLLKQAFRRPE